MSIDVEQKKKKKSILTFLVMRLKKHDREDNSFNGIKSLKFDHRFMLMFVLQSSTTKYIF